ncbi:hypothetical protein [Caulobacter sp. S45]|uniref:hypothetical protein n=1 Tax=Caulobacter sp. S45 TaxID=1641861 RepID=UPI00131AA792|nr:hypothetical protein [Caulobacter sp. S45]
MSDLEPITLQLLFTKEEWDAAMPQLTKDMMDVLRRYRTPVFKDQGDYGDGWGTGGFVEIDGSKFVLTNQHVATVRHDGDRLGIRYEAQEDLVVLGGNHCEKAWPWDLAAIPVSNEAWTCIPHMAEAIAVDQIALAHTPYPEEIFALAGYAGEQTKFLFGGLAFGATTSLAKETELPEDDRWDSRFHFALSYNPDLATTVVGDRGLPTPPGLSGSIVWNTCFVEARALGLTWSPEMAKVAGVVWGWPSGLGFVVATRAEHVRSFLLGIPAALAAVTMSGDAPSEPPLS